MSTVLSTALRPALALALAAACLATAAPPAAAAGPDQLFLRSLHTDDPGGRIAYDGTLVAGDVPLFCQVARRSPVPPRPTVWSGGSWQVPDGEGSRHVTFGRATDTPLCGDWDGDGLDEPGVRRGNRFFLGSDMVRGGGEVTTFVLGRATDTPLAGDWDGDGDDEIALHRGSTFLAARSNVDGGGGLVSSTFGRAGDVAVAGHFALDPRQTHDSLAVRRGSTYHFSADRIGGRMGTVASFPWGRSADLPVGVGVGPAPQPLGLLRVVP